MSQDLCPDTEARLEMLEYLARRALAAASSTSFAGPIFQNEAAARAAAGLPDGEQVFILSHRSIWTKRNGVPGTNGVPPLSAHEVIASNDGSGVLCRTTYSDPVWRVGVNDLYIDPAAPGASDENSGLTAALPLKTGRELFRRWGWGCQLEVGPNLATSPDGFLNIHVLSDIVSPDQLDIRCIISSNASLRIIGGVAATLRTSTITAPPTAMNRAAPLGGTRLRLTDGALANWSAYMTNNRRGRFTNGPAAGGTFQPQADVLAAPGAVDCSPCQTTNEPGFSLVPTTVTPVNGNQYVVESLVSINFGIIDVGQEVNPAFGGVNAFVNVVDVYFPPIGAQFGLGPHLANGTFLNLYQCVIDRPFTFAQGANGYTFFIACLLTDGFQVPAGAVFINGGGAMTLPTTTYPYIGWATQTGQIDYDFCMEKMAYLVSGETALQNCAAWNVGITGANAGAHGVCVGNAGARAKCIFQATVWGNGNGGVGVRIGAACDGIGAIQNITGGTGDLALGNQVGAGGTCVYWNVATSTYLPVGGQGLSWALINSAKGAPGYGGAAHDPDLNAHWEFRETT